MSPEGRDKYKGPCPKCQSDMIPVMGTPTSKAVTAGDEYRGVKHDLDIKDQIKERSAEHFKKHELPRIIEEQGKEFAIRQGFINPSDDPVQ